MIPLSAISWNKSKIHNFFYPFPSLCKPKKEKQRKKKLMDTFIWTYFPSFPSCKPNQIQFLIFILPYSKLIGYFLTSCSITWTLEDLPFVSSHHRKLWETIKRHRHGIQLHGTVGTESNILNLARIARGCWGFLQDEIPSLTPIKKKKKAYYRNSASNKLSSIINFIE